MDTVREMAWALGIIALSLATVWSAGFALSLVFRFAVRMVLA